jgi:hypothetical protein
MVTRRTLPILNECFNGSAHGWFQRRTNCYKVETCDTLRGLEPRTNRASVSISQTHTILSRSRLLTCFYSMEGAHNPGELCKYGYDRQAKGEWASWHTPNPNPQNKQKSSNEISSKEIPSKEISSNEISSKDISSKELSLEKKQTFQKGNFSMKNSSKSWSRSLFPTNQLVFFGG